MRLTIFAAMLAFLLWGTPAFAGNAPDSDADGVADTLDNCLTAPNAAQDDTDGDDCGNLCDADYDQNGRVLIDDFNLFAPAFFTFGNEVFCHVIPIPGCRVLIADFNFYSANFFTIPGPSGTTAGTTACPL